MCKLSLRAGAPTAQKSPVTVDDSCTNYDRYHEYLYNLILSVDFLILTVYPLILFFIKLKRLGGDNHFIGPWPGRSKSESA